MIFVVNSSVVLSRSLDFLATFFEPGIKILVYILLVIKDFTEQYDKLLNKVLNS